ncbi:hypothetical protein HispidOSU_024571, partial [Sigmodon hispidus]
ICVAGIAAAARGNRSGCTWQQQWVEREAGLLARRALAARGCARQQRRRKME